MIPFNTPRQFSYESYQPKYTQYPPTSDTSTYHPNFNRAISDDNRNGNGQVKRDLGGNDKAKPTYENNATGINFCPIIYYSENGRPGATSESKHKKSRSLPKTQFPLINKFQTSLNNTPVKTSSSAEVQLSGTINYPVHQVAGEIASEKGSVLQSIYALIETKKYSTSAIDPLRTYVTVFEYNINNHWIIWDYETGFVHLTGIWKASINDEINTHRNLKADIVKLLESTPKQYHQHIKRIRGGFLKIQGTWLPFGLCKMLAKRFCYHIRFELIPIFGNSFPHECLKPEDKGFGELKLDEYIDSPIPEFRSRIGKKTNKIAKRRSASSLASPLITREPSMGHISPANCMSVDRTPQRLPQFTFPQVPGFANQPFYYQEMTPQYALSSMHSMNHMQHSMSFSGPPSKPVPLLSQMSMINVPFSNAQIPPDPQAQYPLQNSSPGFAPAARSAVHTPHRTPQHSLHNTDSRMTEGNMSHGTPPSEMSYHDMMDLVNASMCLQSLSQTQVSPISHEPTSNREYVTSVPRSPSRNNSSTSGISSILIAAGVSEQSDTSLNHTRRISMKINDILS